MNANSLSPGRGIGGLNETLIQKPQARILLYILISIALMTGCTKGKLLPSQCKPEVVNERYPGVTSGSFYAQKEIAYTLCKPAQQEISVRGCPEPHNANIVVATLHPPGADSDKVQAYCQETTMAIAHTLRDPSEVIFEIVNNGLPGLEIHGNTYRNVYSLSISELPSYELNITQTGDTAVGPNGETRYENFVQMNPK